MRSRGTYCGSVSRERSRSAAKRLSQPLRRVHHLPSLTAIASVSGLACCENRRAPQSDHLVSRRIVRRGNASLPPDADPCKWRETVKAGVRLRPPWSRLTRETLPKLWTNVVVPRPCVIQIFVCFRNPKDGKRHDFLNKLFLTCSHGTTSEGFCSWRAMR
jgi:hypothetical protein